ncbi:MAG: GMC family oxidoreductase N-terminal domain-containing protein [Alphaproteobacteria bacterium]|nr:GMC family oxidoreductase N-terminal domain-containing protein [Alphaproteobacteria bacterium]
MNLFTGGGAQFIYDTWGGLFADHAFCREAFSKMETFTGVTQAPDLRGGKGPFKVIQSPACPLGEKYTDALHEVLKNDYGLNVPVVDDLHAHNGPALSSRGQYFLDPDNHTRVSTSNALLKNKYSGLKILSKSTATKILFQDNKAIGVRFIQQGQTREVLARKKVILCAGPRSAPLLLHSGIGDGEHLNGLGIDVVHNNPEVGRNLTNHLLLPWHVSVPIEDNRERAEAHHLKGISCFSAIPDPQRSAPTDIDLELMVMSPKPGQASFSTILVNPLSRGYVNIASNDPLKPIIIDSQYLSRDEDVGVLVRSLKLQEQVLMALQKRHPDYKIIHGLQDKESYVFENAVHIHHWTGICQIGKVVDSSLQVIGTENLMVADTSAIPEIIRGHTYAAAILMGIAAFREITKIKDWDF